MLLLLQHRLVYLYSFALCTPLDHVILLLRFRTL